MRPSAPFPRLQRPVLSADHPRGGGGKPHTLLQEQTVKVCGQRRHIRRQDLPNGDPEADPQTRMESNLHLVSFVKRPTASWWRERRSRFFSVF